MSDEYSKEMAIDLFRQGFSIKSVIRRVAKKTKTTQRDIKPAVERDLFEYVMERLLSRWNGNKNFKEGIYMENFIQINGQRIVLTEGQTAAIGKAFAGEEPEYTVGDVPAGDACTIGGFEFIVLEHIADKTAVLMKGLLHEEETFGENNDYRISNVDKLCETFADTLAEKIGEDAIVQHTVDLTSDDGLKDYGAVERKASLLTTEQYRRYVEILDKHKLDKWWWLSTPYSTPAHEDDEWIKCVSPSGNLNYGIYNDLYGVRPFCILKSDILVSK